MNIYLHAFPVMTKQVADWIVDGSVAAGRVSLKVGLSLS
jgi:hypothetical protein